MEGNETQIVDRTVRIEMENKDQDFKIKEWKNNTYKKMYSLLTGKL